MTGGYNFDDALTQCPLCSSHSFSLFETTTNRGVELHNHICTYCGLVFLSPRMSPHSITQFYAIEYRTGAIESGKPMQWVIEKERNRALYQADILAKWHQRPHRLLDIGASSGQLLRVAADKFQCVCVGVEPGDVYRTEASQILKLYQSLEMLIEAQEPRFDLITMSHVLEHLPSPVHFLKLVRENILHENGVLYIEVPNLYGHSCFEPSHLYSFTDKTLGIMLNAAGFCITQLEIHSAPRNFGWRNISALACPTPAHPPQRQIIIPAWVKLQRMIGLSGTRHWYGYLYLQLRKKLAGE